MIYLCCVRLRFLAAVTLVACFSHKKNSKISSCCRFGTFNERQFKMGSGFYLDESYASKLNSFSMCVDMERYGGKGADIFEAFVKTTVLRCNNSTSKQQ